MYIVRSENGTILTKDGIELTFKTIKDAEKQINDLQYFSVDIWTIVKID